MKRTLRTLATIGSIAALAAIGMPAATAADYVEPQVAWTGTNITVSPDGSAAYITGKYNCVGGTEGTHLWVSVKQGPGIDADHTGSGDATAWYDTNWNYSESDPDGLNVDCDGHWHVTRYTLKSEPGWGELVDGIAFVQFCLFDNTGNEENFPQGFAFDYSWKTVRVP
jgi:opacity protein-like surface antigen